MGDDVLRMAGCFAAVAAAAVPVGLAGWRLARRPLRPPVRPWRVPVTGIEVFGGFFVVSLVIPAVATLVVGAGPGSLAGGGSEASRAAVIVRAAVLALPFQLGLAFLTARATAPGRSVWVGRRAIPARVAVGVLVWAVLTPTVLLTHYGVGLLFRELGWGVGEHPLTEVEPDGPLLERVLFALSAGVAAPAVEELLFRGLLLGYLIGGRSLVPRFGARRAASGRGVWAVLAIGVAMAALTSGGGPVLERGAVLFAAGLAGGWLVVREVFPRKRRTVGAVYASAALFAAVHSAVWPSPVPLFVLGLGLGWLAVRTRGVVAPIVVHGLFNAVSVLFVLRGGS